MIERRSLLNINLIIVIIIFILLCVSYILFIPVFEAPDEPGHFLYAFYISKYNRIPSQYNESISTTQYIEENIDKNADEAFYMDGKYMFYRMPSSSSSGYLWRYCDQRHHPPLYYLISSQIIKPFGIDNIDAEINYGNYNNPNRFINNKILKDSTPTIFLVLILRLFQIIYGVLIIIFIYKIIKLLSNNKFEKKSIFLISGIAFLPQFIFLCSYVNNDVLSALFGLISIYFTALLFKRNKAYFGLLSVLFSIIASFTKPTILIMIPLTVIGLVIWAVIRKKKWAILAVLVILILVGGAFYLITNYGKGSYQQVRVKAEWDKSHWDENRKIDINNSVKNYGLSLNGEGNRISVLSTPSSEVTELTVEAWIYIRNFNGGGMINVSTPIISDYNVWNSKQGYLLTASWRADYQKMLWQFYINDNINNPKVLNFDYLSYDDFVSKYANRWLHISGIFKSGEYIKFLINGEVKETLDVDIPEKIRPEEDTSLWFGYSGINPGYTDGIIDEVRIWDVARSEEQIIINMYKELMGSEEELLGYWNFNKGRFSTVYDSTPNKNHGTIYETTEYSSPLLNRIIRVGSGIINKFKEGFKDSLLYARIELPKTFKSSTAIFGWMNIYADRFIYYFFLVYVVSGIVLFFVNIKKYMKSKKSIIFMILLIISIFIYFMLYAIYGDWEQQQGRIILLAIFLTYILVILGFKSIKTSYRNILYYVLFSSSLIISVFCLYNYIYLNYY